MQLSLYLLLICSTATATVFAGPPLTPFHTNGSRVYDASGNWIVFRGIGLSCTEYMSRPIFPGQYGYDACFGGTPPGGAPGAAGVELNGEINNVASLLRADTSGGTFVTQPNLTRVAWPAPYDEVLAPASMGSPRVVPIVRIPLTSATWLFDAEANALTSAGYRRVIDLLITNLTSQGIAVILDQHGNCAGGGSAPLNCSNREGPMSLRDFGEEL